MTALFAAIIVFVLYKVTRAQSSRVETGVEGLVGEIGQVTVALDPEGKVFVHGEIWEAVSRSGTLPRGASVQVVGVRNMTLLVDTLEPDHPADRSAS